MKRFAMLFLLVAMMMIGTTVVAEEEDFVNVYLCTFHENNTIGPRVVSLVKDNTGYYLDTINGYILDMTWERDGNVLYVNPVDTSYEQLRYIVLHENDEYQLSDMNGNIYSVDSRVKEQNQTEENESDGGYTIDDVLGKWICKDKKQIIHIMPQYTSHFIFEGGGLGNDILTLHGETLELEYTGVFAIEPFNNTLKLICTKAGNVAEGSEFVKVEDIVDEKELYGTWKGTKETRSTITIDESGVYYSLTHTINDKSSTTQSGSSSLDFAGDTIYIRTELTLTIVKKDGSIELVTDNDRFVR